jgi:hypothetical protein
MLMQSYLVALICVQLGCLTLIWIHSTLFCVFSITVTKKIVFYRVPIWMNEQSHKFCNYILTQGNFHG